MKDSKNEALKRIKRKNRSIKTWWIALAFTLLLTRFIVPSSLGTLAAQDSGGDDLNVEITFTKWLTEFPNMEGVVGGDVGTGTFVGEIIEFIPGTVVNKIDAKYHINGGEHSFTAHVFVRQNDVTQTAVITGEITDGWMLGRHVRGNFAIIACADQTNGVCYQGVLHAYVTAQADTEAQAKFENAMSAAPMSIAQDATVLDNAVDANGNNIVLQEGNNGWTCFPDNPDSPGNDPACYDAVWMDAIGAAMAGEMPNVTAPGFAYMLQGGSHASNTDPTATQPAEGDDWVTSGAHMMIILPGTVDISSFSTDGHSVYPNVMFADTPLQHLMVPVADMEPMAH